MGKKVIIVESINDQYFIEAFIEARNSSIFGNSTEVKPLQVEEFDCLGGDNSKKLKDSHRVYFLKSKKESIDSIGVILDQDQKSHQDRLYQVNGVIQEVFSTQNKLSSIGSFGTYNVDQDISLNTGLYLQQVNNTGNLETVLKEIKRGNSDYADCLDQWRFCIKLKGKFIKDSDFDKFWVQLHQRYDQCFKEDQKQAGRKCNNEASMQKDIWDFSHTCLDNLSMFIQSL